MFQVGIGYLTDQQEFITDNITIASSLAANILVRVVVHLGVGSLTWVVASSRIVAFVATTAFVVVVTLTQLTITINT